MKKLLKNIVGNILRKYLQIILTEDTDVKYGYSKRSDGSDMQYIYGKMYKVTIKFDGEVLTESKIFK